MKNPLVKNIYIYLFIFLSVGFLLLPLMTTIDHFLTRSLNSFGNNNFIQEHLIPHEAKIIAVILKPLGFEIMPTPTGIYVNKVLVTIWWSCIGWQSLILTLLSFWPGFTAGKFTLSSKIETIILGILGFFFITVIRLVTVSVIGAYFGTQIALLYHDIFATTILTIIWLFFFWWFSYTFILEENRNV